MIIKRLVPLPTNIFFTRSLSKSYRAISPEIRKKFVLPARYSGSQSSVWVEYTQLAAKHNPLNLGLGFPDFAPPDCITNAFLHVAKCKNDLIHQYTRGYGHPRLITVLSKLYSELIGRDINPQTEILVSAGAYEALFSTIVGHVDQGDEVIIIEPYFDCYEPMVLSTGGVPRFIPFRLEGHCSKGSTSTSDWGLDIEELEVLFNSKTKAIILNTPNNPLGKVFTLPELERIANLCKEWNVLCISDEVYEWMVYEPNKHIRIASLPGMWERTITIGSAGKTFGITGWKTGWAYGPANLMHNLYMVHQNCVYTCVTPIQEAIAIGFEKELTHLGSGDCYLTSLSHNLIAKRDLMATFLTDVGMKPVIPEGGFFLIANWTPLEPHINLDKEKDKYKDYRFTKWMTKKVGLQGIPTSAFYSVSHKNLGEQFVRFCFMKKDENLRKAAELLEKWKRRSRSP